MQTAAVAPTIPVATVPARLESFAREVAHTYSNHIWSPDQLYSIMADAIRMINHDAHDYADPSCVELNQEELEAEGRRKLVEIFHGKSGKGSSVALSLSNRKELFAWIKSCIKNHMRGIVGRHRNTAKRTGTRPPSKSTRPELGDQFKHDTHGVGTVVRLLNTSGDSATHFGLPYVEIQPEWGKGDEITAILTEAGYEVNPQRNGRLRVTGLAMTEACSLLAELGRATNVRFNNNFVATVRLRLEDGGTSLDVPVAEFAQEWRPRMETFNGRPKPEVSLDAVPEVRSAIEFMAMQSPRDTGLDEDEMAEILSPVEFLVYQEFLSPGRATMELAKLDARRGCEGEEPLNIVIKPVHYARGLGLGIIEFDAAVLSLRRKVESYLSRVTTTLTCQQVGPEVREWFTPTEFLVYQQLVSPNRFSTLLAQARRDDMRPEYLAAGIGLELSTFFLLTENVRSKIKNHMEQQPHNAAVSALERVFDVQVPRSLDALVVRRLFTIAARSNPDKVNEDVANLLRTVGSEIPVADSQGNLRCFGVLYADHGEESERICSRCAARTACEARARNAGLDLVTISPSLFSARAKTRTVVVPELPESAPVVTSARTETVVPKSEREEAIRAHLQANYKEVYVHGSGGYFKHKTARRDGRVKHIVWVGQSHRPVPDGVNPSFLIRVCSERPSMRKELGLVRMNQCWYIPDAMSVSRVLEVIDAHADYLFHLKLKDKE